MGPCPLDELENRMPLSSWSVSYLKFSFYVCIHSIQGSNSSGQLLLFQVMPHAHNCTPSVEDCRNHMPLITTVLLPPSPGDNVQASSILCYVCCKVFTFYLSDPCQAPQVCWQMGGIGPQQTCSGL